MSEKAPAAALADLRANTTDVAALSKIVRWLQKSEVIREKAEESDLEALVMQVAEGGEPDSKTALLRMQSELECSSGTTLIAVFPEPAGEKLWQFGPVTFGPVNVVVGEHLRLVADSLDTLASPGAFAFRVEESAIGVRGSTRALDWLRAAIGALYLAGRIAGRADARLSPMRTDELSPVMFFGSSSSLRSVVDALHLSPTMPVDVDALLEDFQVRGLVADCLQARPSDLVEKRLRLAAPWLQCSFDSMSFPDAILSLGVALETLIGTEGTGDVVKTVAIRTAFLLRVGETQEERTLSASDWRGAAKRLYGARSVIAHGRYERGKKSEAEERRLRQDFEQMVCLVAAQFRLEGKRHGWTKDLDLTSWQEYLELG